MKHSWLIAAALLAAACSPQVFPLHLELRQPSKSGLDLSRKSMSIVYMDSPLPADTLFGRTAASALARNLESDYFGSEEAIGLYQVPRADSVSLDLMHSLVMDTGSDVVFLLTNRLGAPAFTENKEVPGATQVDSAYVCEADIPVVTHLFVYDSMATDEVHRYKGSATLRASVYNNGMTSSDGLRTLAWHSLGKQAEEVGRRLSSRFISEWKQDAFRFYYFDDVNVGRWVEGLSQVQQGKLSAAVDTWMPLVKEGNAQKRACAAFNVAQTFYLMGDYGLAARWLDVATRLENLDLAPGLSKRLAAHLEK